MEYLMPGPANVCKVTGSVTVSYKDGRKVRWLYDYVNDLPRLESEMTEQEIEASNILRERMAEKADQERRDDFYRGIISGLFR